METSHLWKIAEPCTAVLSTPKLEVLNMKQCKISFELELDDDVVPINLIFRSVEAFRCTYLNAIEPIAFMTSYQKLIIIENSMWLRDVTGNINKKSQKSGDFQPTLKHMAICFDDGPYFEFLCTDFYVVEGDSI